VSAHAEFLRAASHDNSLAGQIKSDFRKAKLSQKDLRMLEFAEKLTTAPWLTVESDILSLRQSGFKDVEILHIVLGCSHFNYLNRMADGIGITFDYKTEVPAFQMRPTDGRGPTVSFKSFPPEKPVTHNSNAWIRFPAKAVEPPTADEPENLFRVMGENAEACSLARQWRRFQLNATAALPQLDRTRLALYISALNHCDYSVYWYKKLLVRLGENPALAILLAEGREPSGLGPLPQLQFVHCRRLTLEPWTSREEHVEALRKAGMDDLGILQLTMLASYLSFENRVALGLGVAIETGQ
jgi:alkylhydroperoxidase family enzyme